MRGRASLPLSKLAPLVCCGLILLDASRPIAQPRRETIDRARAALVRANDLVEREDYVGARPIAEEAVKELERTGATATSELDDGWHLLSRIYFALDERTAAVDAKARQFEIEEKLLGPEHASTIATLETLASLRLGAKGARPLDDAATLYERVLERKRRLYGPENMEVASALRGLADAKIGTHTTDALRLYGEALDMQVRVDRVGRSPEESYIKLSQIAYFSRRYWEAKVATERAFALHDPHDLDEVAMYHNDLAELEELLGDFTSAEKHLVDSLHVNEKAGAPRRTLAESHLQLAVVQRRSGKYLEAQASFEQATSLAKTLPKDDLLTSTIAAGEGDLHRELGNAERAMELYRRSMELFPGDEGASQGRFELQEWRRIRFEVGVGIAQITLGMDELKDASDVLREVLTSSTMVTAIGPIFERQVHRAQIDLARTLRESGNFDFATELLEGVLERELRHEGDASPLLVPEALHEMGLVVWMRGDPAAGDKRLLEALQRAEELLGTNHLTTGEILRDRAALNMLSLHDIDAAIDYASRAAEIRDRSADQILAVGGGETKRAFLESMAVETGNLLILHFSFAPKRLDAARLALTALLRHKGRAVEETAGLMRAVHRRADASSRQRLRDLLDAQRELTMGLIQGPRRGESGDAYEVRLAQWRTTSERLEDSLARDTAGLMARREPVTIERVQQALGSNRSLVEFTRFPSVPTEGHGDIEDHYAAYVVGSSGDPTWIDLGVSAPIDDLVERFRDALADPGSRAYRELGRALHDRIWAPLRPLLRTRRIFVSPESALGTVPLDALVDGEGRYLLETLQLSYLTSGRDLLRFEAGPTANKAAIIAAPAFDEGQRAAAKGTTRSQRSSDFQQHFDPLPGTAVEADRLQAILGVRALRGGAATETSVKELIGPEVLHIATHGFFLPDARDAVGPRRMESPMLRSGLALAGANLRRSGDDDGILTALEASNLDLHGTRLVVLSACDTGLGDVVNSDGIYGLRRAMMLAGAETMVMSLWKVDDEVTSDLMADYYRRLAQGAGRTAALHDSQLSILAQQGTAHPYYWASFTAIGNPAPLGHGGAPWVAGRGQRGCACATGATTSEAGIQLAVGAMTLAAICARRRRRSCARA